jgi:hypothetical protein
LWLSDIVYVAGLTADMEMRTLVYPGTAHFTFDTLFKLNHR